MRLIIELDEKYKNLIFELAKAIGANVAVDPEDWMAYPEYVRRGVEKSLEQARNGQTKTYEEVKEILANRKKRA